MSYWPSYQAMLDGRSNYRR